MSQKNELKFSVTSIHSLGNDISVEITVENGKNSCKECFVISTAAYVDLDVKKGECSPEFYEALEREAKTYAAYNRGAYIISFGLCSEKMLISKLIQKGFERDASIGAVARLRDKGLLNNSKNAAREAEKCASKLWGRSRIKAELIKKGYSSDEAEKAIFALEDFGIDFDKSCEALIDKKYPSLPKDRVEIGKLVSSVARYGYSLAQIKSAIIKVSEKRRKDAIYGL